MKFVKVFSHESFLLYGTSTCLSAGWPAVRGGYALCAHKYVTRVLLKASFHIICTKYVLVWPASPLSPSPGCSFFLSIMGRRGGVDLAGQTKTYMLRSVYQNVVQGHPIIGFIIWPTILECPSYGNVKWEFFVWHKIPRKQESSK